MMGVQQCRELVEYHRQRNCRVDDQTGCWIFTGRSVNGSGYPLVKAVPRLVRPNPGSTAFLLHRVALVSRLGRDIQHEASHRCGVALCFNPVHLVDETHPVNESRKYCVGELVCLWHGHPIGNFCVHGPSCIRPPRDDLICCLKLKESDPEGWAQLDTQPTSSSVAAESSFSRSLAPVPQPPEVSGTFVPDSLSTIAASEGDLYGGSSSPATGRAPPSSPPRNFAPRSGPQSSSPSLGSVNRGWRGAPRAHDPPSSPLSPVRQSQRPRRDTSSSLHSEQSETVDDTLRPPTPQRRLARRPGAAPDTQHQQAMEAYFEEEEEFDSDYAQDASAIRRNWGPDSSSSYRDQG